MIDLIESQYLVTCATVAAVMCTLFVMLRAITRRLDHIARRVEEHRCQTDTAIRTIIDEVRHVQRPEVEHVRVGDPIEPVTRRRSPPPPVNPLASAERMADIVRMPPTSRPASLPRAVVVRARRDS